MNPANHFQLLLLLFLFTQCLAECSNNSTSEATSWNKKCKSTAKKYGLCRKGRGFCYRKGDNIEGKRLRCYDGLPCGCFPDVDNGYFVLTDPKDNVLGATAKLNCYPGYSVKSSTIINCKVNATWSRTSRKCKPVDCGPIPSIENGSYVSKFRTTYPAVGYMVCDEGFVLTYSSPDDAILRCEENGVWNFRPVTCMPVDCGNPPTLQHGAFNASSRTDYLSEAFLVCDSASVPVNENLTRIVCESSGDWTAPQTICVAPDCGPIPSIENGSYVTTNGTTYPSAGYMLCDEGFVLTYSSPDDAILRCEENGVWNFRPVTCMPVDCGNPPTLQHGAFNASSRTDYLSEAFLVCDSASVPVNENLTRIVCESSGDWTAPQTICVAPECGPIPSIENGSYFTTNGTTYPSAGYMLCDEGFVLTYSSPDDAILRCEENGVWNFRPVTCMPVDCGNPPTLQHGAFNASSRTDYLSEAFLVCDSASVPVNENLTRIVCESSGDWTAPQTICVAPDCGPIPSIENGSYFTTNGTTYPSAGYMFCDEGFVLTYSSPDDAILRCEENGVWNFRPVTCMPVDCGNPPTLQHGVFNASSGTDYLSEADLVCDNAFVPANENLTRIVCESSGDWTAPQTICVAPGCPVAIPSPLEWRPCVQISNMTLLVVSAHGAYKATAKSNCKLVGDLARIDDPAKLSALQDYLNAQPEYKDLWVQGGHDGSDWRFSNGDLMPNDIVMWYDADASSPCVVLKANKDYRFDDRGCSGYHRYICEISE